MDYEELVHELGIEDSDWLPQQPEPTSDCDEFEHYGMLWTFGQCMTCMQRGVFA